MTDQALILQEKLLECRNNKDKLAIIRELLNHYKSKQQFILYREWGEKYLKIALELKKDKHIADANYVLGESCLDLGLFDNAMQHLLKALQLNRELNDNKLTARTLNLIGVVYGRMYDHDKALSCFLEALNYKDENKPSLNNIGIIYYHKNEFDKALEYQFEALKVAEKTGDKFKIVFTKSFIATIYSEMGKYDESIEQSQQC